MEFNTPHKTYRLWKLNSIKSITSIKWHNRKTFNIFPAHEDTYRNSSPNCRTYPCTTACSDRFPRRKGCPRPPSRRWCRSRTPCWESPFWMPTSRSTFRRRYSPSSRIWLRTVLRLFESFRKVSVTHELHFSCMKTVLFYNELGNFVFLFVGK